MLPNSLFDTAPGFDQPIAVLKHCHDRIRKQIATLQKLVLHLPKLGADRDAQLAATAVLRYFNVGAPHHHADEELDLIPVLQTVAQGADAMLLQEILPQILQEHHQMNSLWQQLAPQLEQIACGQSAELDGDVVKNFCDTYILHMEKEETHVAPMAKRLFSPMQMAQLGAAMQARRMPTDA